MQKLPFRTNTTWLSDDDLILLDVLFDCGVMFRHLRRDNFQLQWNLGYAHSLDDDQLRCRLRWLIDHCVLDTDRHENRNYFRMTANGGQLWSQERCPIWDRFCTERYKITLRNRTMMSVVAVSPQIRDDFLRLWPMYPARLRTATIADYGLVPWLPFPELHVGIATYDEQSEWTPEEYAVYLDGSREYQAVLQRERSWWRFVSELQRFIPNAA
jgi:hypothetical protein